MVLGNKTVSRRRRTHARDALTHPGVHPARTVALAFAIMVSVGTLLLMLPGMRAGGGGATLTVALFTAVSASCVTGLAVVDTGTYWSTAGQVTILLLIQVGGFGIMTLGTLAAILITRRVGLQTRLATSAESGTAELGALRPVLRGVAVITLIVELGVGLALALRLALGYDLPVGKSLWYGVFHSISAFNNAGFALASDSLTAFRTDGLIMIPVSLAIILGGLGFPVMLEVTRRLLSGRRPLERRRRMTDTEIDQRAAEIVGRVHDRIGVEMVDRRGFAGPVSMSLHTRLMLYGTGLMLLIGTLGFAAFEWRNPDTLGGQPMFQRLFQAFFSGGVTPRTAGFNTISYAEVSGETRFLTDGLMFIGGGSASTAGGIKITTLLVLLMAAAAEVRGTPEVNALDRRLPNSTVRIALAVVMVSFMSVMIGTLTLMSLTMLDLDLALFEVISALATVGLSADVTPTLPDPAQLLLVVLMLLGRIGPITLVSALSLRSAELHYRLPEGKPLIG